MATEKFVSYRGDIKAVAGVGGTLVFVTLHPEGQPTAVYRLDADKLTLATDALPAGGVAVVADANTIWAAGSDQRVYQLPLKGGTPAPLGAAFDAPLAGLALLAGDRLGVLTGNTVCVLNRADGTRL